MHSIFRVFQDLKAIVKQTREEMGSIDASSVDRILEGIDNDKVY